MSNIEQRLKNVEETVNTFAIRYSPFKTLTIAPGMQYVQQAPPALFQNEDLSW